ncbi:MAG: hypothetical protein LBG46_00255, partial [Elusimicrobiota bacterium]|nr:hypothetical protein [Elusimicrobiota bacterium]
AVKIATLTAQLVKVKKEKISLEQRIEKMQRDIEVIVQNEKEKTQIVSSLKEKISDNDVIIEKLKKDIILLAAENRELKFEAEKTVKRENILRAKISEIEGEKKKLETFRSLSPTSPHIKQTARRSQVSDELQSLNTDAAVSVNSADNNLNKNKEPISVLNLTEAKSPVEIIDIKGNSNSMDLSMIFDKSASSAAAASAARPSSLAETIDLTKTELSTETSAVTQDHAAKIVIRQPMSRVPQSFRESEAYSDFLKKTKSVFYRIKWSLFKDQ